MRTEGVSFSLYTQEIGRILHINIKQSYMWWLGHTEGVSFSLYTQEIGRILHINIKQSYMWWLGTTIPGGSFAHWDRRGFLLSIHTRNR